tara:strand:+ start:673 stop:1551 length:879 start_codon:yes stop_codon:yes gene_type:complete
MSWNGTVYCGFCGTKGHNKAGCAERKAYAAKSPNGPIAAQLRMEDHRRKEAVKRRACTYCQQPGHNRRGCEVRKQDIEKINECQKSFTRSFSHRCSQLGLAPGALVLHTGEEWNTLMYIERIFWPAIDFSLRDFGYDNYGRIPWQIEDTKLFTARVVSQSVPREMDLDRWHDAPHQPGDHISLQFGSIHSLFEGILMQPKAKTTPFGAPNESRHGKIEVVSPIVNPALDTDARLIVRTSACPKNNYTLEKFFNVFPSKPRASYAANYFRLDSRNRLWKNVRPEEHRKACQAQ